jgi:hypothetical protein
MSNLKFRRSLVISLLTVALTACVGNRVVPLNQRTQVSKDNLKNTDSATTTQIGINTINLIGQIKLPDNLVAAGAGAYKLLSNSTAVGQKGVDIVLTDAKGNPIKSIAPVQTDNDGRFIFKNVPIGYTVIVAAQLKDKFDKPVALRSIVKLDREVEPVTLSASSTFLTGALLANLKETENLGSLETYLYKNVEASLKRGLVITSAIDLSNIDELNAQVSALAKKDPDLNRNLFLIKSSLEKAPASTLTRLIEEAAKILADDSLIKPQNGNVDDLYQRAFPQAFTGSTSSGSPKPVTSALPSTTTTRTPIPTVSSSTGAGTTFTTPYSVLFAGVPRIPGNDAGGNLLAKFSGPGRMIKHNSDLIVVDVGNRSLRKVIAGEVYTVQTTPALPADPLHIGDGESGAFLSFKTSKLLTHYNPSNNACTPVEFLTSSQSPMVLSDDIQSFTYDENNRYLYVATENNILLFDYNDTNKKATLVKQTGMVGFKPALVATSQKRLYISLKGASSAEHVIKCLDFSSPAPGAITVSTAFYGFKEAVSDMIYNQGDDKIYFLDPGGVISFCSQLSLRSGNVTLNDSQSPEFRTLIGQEATTSYTEGDRNTATFNTPTGFYFNNAKELIVSDSKNHVLRKILL